MVWRRHEHHHLVRRDALDAAARMRLAGASEQPVSLLSCLHRRCFPGLTLSLDAPSLSELDIAERNTATAQAGDVIAAASSSTQSQPSTESAEDRDAYWFATMRAAFAKMNSKPRRWQCPHCEPVQTFGWQSLAALHRHINNKHRQPPNPPRRIRQAAA